MLYALKIAGFILIGLMVLLGGLAAGHLDSGKITSETERREQQCNSMVPEKVLTPKGRRIAFYRNLCAAFGFGFILVYFAVMELLGRSP